MVKRSAGTDKKPVALAIAQAFKGTLSVSEVAAAFTGGITAAGATPLVLPASDGGDGLLDALAPRLVRVTSHPVTGPLGAPVTAPAGWLDPETAVIETRLVCGLSLLRESDRNPLGTTTRGVGELITQVLREGARSVLVGLGGSATMDGGVGMARAWGFVPVDADGAELAEGGGALARLAGFRGGTVPGVQLTGLSDVRNPLTGDRGARVFAAQKGGGPDAVERLADGLRRLADVAAAGGRGDLAPVEGAGAAGGLGFGLLWFGGGTLVSGAEWFLGHTGFAEAVRSARLVLTGEGAFDATSLDGKLTGRVIATAREAGVPVALLAPRVERVPPGTMVESGGGQWDSDELCRRVQAVVERALRAAPTA